MHNFAGHEAIINTLSMNEEGVMFSGGKSDHPVIRSRVDSDLADNGTLTMWDYATGLPFQHLKDIPQPGSLDAEAVSGLQFYFGRIADDLGQGVFCSAFDKTGTRLITGGADKTIKVYSEQA